MSDTKSPLERAAATRRPYAESASMPSGDNRRSKVDFLPLSDVLDAITRCIVIRDDELVSNPHAGPLGDRATAYMTMLEAGAIKQAYRASRAATVLGLSLANAPADRRPRWFDTAVARGEPWQSDAAGAEGHNLLVDSAKWEHAYKEEQRRLNQIAGSRWSAGEGEWSSVKARFKDWPPIPRGRHIGFERAEIIEFLLDQQIPNAFVVPIPAREMSAATNGALMEEEGELAHAQARSPAGVQPANEMDELPLLQAHNTAAKDPLSKERPNFRGTLAEPLTIAWEEARNPNEAHSVLAAFVDLARRQPPHSPLLGASEDGQEVKWLRDDGEIEIFTIRDMQSRMRSVPKSRT